MAPIAQRCASPASRQDTLSSKIRRQAGEVRVDALIQSFNHSIRRGTFTILGQDTYELPPIALLRR